MRNAGVNAQTAKIYGEMGWFDVRDSMRVVVDRRDDILAGLPSDLCTVLAGRIDQMADLIGITDTLSGDAWIEDYVGNFCRHTIGMRKYGVVGALPSRLDRRGIEIFDESGERWDQLRGRNSTMGQLADYMRENGGDMEIISRWMEQQGGSSWSRYSQAAKYRIASKRGGNFDDYYWGSDGVDGARRRYKRAVDTLGQEYEESWTAWHAFNRELLQNVAFEHNDIGRGVVRLVRTESASVMRHYGMSPGDTDTIKRGAAESGSLYQTVVVSGRELTVQEVPHHRILGTYFTERRPGSNHTPFYGDRENEFVFIPEGIRTTYLGGASAGTDTADIWRDFDRMRGH